MAVELLTFPAASALIGEGACDGEMELFSNIHDHGKIVDQCQNGEDFQSEVDRVLKHLLLQLKSQTQIKDAMARPANTLDDVDMESSRSNDQSEHDDQLVSIMTCGEGDGGHRCPYFPCPYCHRNRDIFIPESNLDAHSQSYDSNSDRRTLMTGEEDEVIDQEAPLVIGANADDRDAVFTDQSVPAVTCSEGDGGHRCPYFPCPYCHRTRSTFVPESNYNIDSPNVDCKVDCISFMKCEEDMIPHADVEYYSVSRIDDQRGAPVLTCPDKGHTCPYFPCPICHRIR